MFRTASSPILRLCLIFIFCNIVASRHLHRPRIHRHHVRQHAETVAATYAQILPTPSKIPALTGGNAVIADVEEIEKGSTDLMRDIRNFVTSVERRLQTLESWLAGLLSPATHSAPKPEATPVVFPPSPSYKFNPTPPGLSVKWTPTHTRKCNPHASSIGYYECAGHVYTGTARTSPPWYLYSTTAFGNSGAGVRGTAITPTPSMYLTALPPQNTSAAAVTITVQYATSETTTSISVTGTSNTSVATIPTPTPPSPSTYIFNQDATDNVVV